MLDRRKLLRHAASGAAPAVLALGVVPACATDAATDTASDGSDALADSDRSAESRLSVTD
ncbi:MAG: hypothetical protein ISQ28_05740 [Alphaproteobacteria bacterium]|nr:hypothetical protein [Alphaproteobacteria bacterium]